MHLDQDQPKRRHARYLRRGTQTQAKDWDKVWANLADAVKRKGKCTIGVQCVVLPENVYEMRELASLCVDVGVDYLVLKPYSQGTFSITHKYEGVDYAAMRTYLEGVKDFDTKTFKVIYRTEAMNQEISGSITTTSAVRRRHSGAMRWLMDGCSPARRI
jgi:hypothetical protein